MKILGGDPARGFLRVLEIPDDERLVSALAEVLAEPADSATGRTCERLVSGLRAALD